MSQLCPVCKTPLWTDPLFTPSLLRCPRCGARFRPTVAWPYFRFLFLVTMLLGILVVAFLSSRIGWAILLLLAGVLAFFWLLPKLIDLQPTPKNWSTPEGVTTGQQLHLPCAGSDRKDEERTNWYAKNWPYLMLALLMGLLLLGLLIAST